MSTWFTYSVSIKNMMDFFAIFFSSSLPLSPLFSSNQFQKNQTFLADGLKKAYKAQAKISGHSVANNLLYESKIIIRTL